MFPGMKARKLLISCLCVAAAVIVCITFYIKTHPMVFNESSFEHAHCIVQTGSAFRNYADDHNGHFPFSTNGYGDALLLLSNYVGDFWACLTGPGYDGQVFAMAAQTGQHIPEIECGRVYVQGLTKSDNPEIALLFDKMPSPGGDHCTGFHRIRAPLSREVLLIDSSRQVVKESEWDAFAKRQVDLLLAAGIKRSQAEKYYSEEPKR
jgi:hypothetical protein